jgi:hypothetical protein
VSHTYTSNTLNVTDGEITEHDTSKDDDINILSAECRWHGVETSESVPASSSDERSYNDNAFAYYQDNEDIWFSEQTPSLTGNEQTFDKTAYFINWENLGIDVDHYEADVELEVYDNNDNLVDSKTGTVDFAGAKVSDTPASFNSYPPVKIEYTTFHPDYYVRGRFWDNSSPSTKGSGSESANLQVGVINYYTEVSHTVDPFVTRDVDGSYSGNIDGGTWSPWVTLNGLAANENNEFYHNISGSNEADYEFTYDWDYQFPTAQKQFRLYDEDQNTIHKVALADPSDSLLNYNHHRYALNGTVYALDVVDPSDENAIDWVKWYHPTHGEYCPRAYDTIQL